MRGDCIESGSIIGIERREVIGWSGHRRYSQFAPLPGGELVKTMGP
jgi:hypothetical protein